MKRKIRENNVIGTICAPDGIGALPGIIIVPGSDGGIPEAFADKLAAEGYAVLALGYFGIDDLPAALENIYLEYFQHAIKWFRAQPEVDESVTLLGYSRGGELVLLLGSFFPELINAIVAYVPSSVVCGGFPHPNVPAWTYNNQPIAPFLPGLMSDDKTLTEENDLYLACQSGQIPFHKNSEDDPYVIADLFRARNKLEDALSNAAIPVENIRCPILILSGEDDKIWPSNQYCELIDGGNSSKNNRQYEESI